MSQPPLLCAFDAGHRHFVCATVDHRIKLWDVTTGTLLHQHQPPHHLTASYTSLTWTLTHPPASPPTPSPSSSPSSSPLGHLLLGSHTGGLTLLDLSTGDCTSPSTPSSLPRVQSSPVLAVGLHPPTSQLFVATADCQLHRYAFPSLTLLSSMPTPSPVTLLPSLTPLPTLLPLALGPSLALLDLSPPSPSSFALHRRFASTSSDLCSVAVSEDGQLYATGQPTSTPTLTHPPSPRPRSLGSPTPATTRTGEQPGRRSLPPLSPLLHPPR